MAGGVAEALKLRVIMDNDATAAALGEHWRGIGDGAESFIYLYLGTGIGSGLVLDGQAYRGLRGNTGEISHIQVDPDGPPCECGSHGCLALYTNPDGLLREAAKAALDAPPPSRSRPPRRSRSSPRTPTRASSGRDNRGRALRKVVVECSRVLDPELIVLGGPLVPTLGGPTAMRSRRPRDRSTSPGPHRPGSTLHQRIGCGRHRRGDPRPARPLRADGTQAEPGQPAAENRQARQRHRSAPRGRTHAGVKQGYPPAAAATLAAAALALGVDRVRGRATRARGSGSVKGQTIEYWASNQGATIDQDKQVINEAIERFKKESGVTVKFKVIPWADLWNNITTATTSGKGPDVLNIGNTWSASLQATGRVHAVRRRHAEGDRRQGQVPRRPPTPPAARPGRTPTSVPLYGLSYALFYNKKLFKDAGLQPPKTWTEFVDTAKKLTKDTNGDGKPDQWGFAMEGGSITENSHFAFILGRQNGGELFDGNKPTFDSDPIVKGVSDYVNLIGRDKVADPSNAQYADGTRTAGQFAKGKTGMMIYQNNAENNLKSEGMKKSEYGVAELPVADGSDTPIMTHVAGINLSVFTNTKKKAAALEFVKFLTSPERAGEAQPVVREPAGGQAGPVRPGVLLAQPQDVQRRSSPTTPSRCR